MRFTKLCGNPLKVPRFVTLCVIGLTLAGVPAASAKHGRGLGLGAWSANVEGTWRWEERTLVVLPGEIAMLVFGVASSEGPVMILFCVSRGDMTLTQSGDDFSGFATQSSWCRTAGGQSAATTPFPPGFGVSGRIQGHRISFSADVGSGIDCSYSGVVHAWLGDAFAVNASGGCVVPAPFEPNISKSLSFDMYRQ